MPSYRLNLTIDEDFALILKHFKSQYPLSSYSDIIRMILGQQFVASRNAARKAWSDSLPELKLTESQMADLEKNIEESIASGFDKSFSNSQELMDYIDNNEV
jgi:hypothetical protein